MRCVCGVDLVPFNNDNAWKICPACRVEYTSGGEPLPVVSDVLAAIRSSTVSWESLGPVLPGEYYCNGKRIM